MKITRSRFLDIIGYGFPLLYLASAAYSWLAYRTTDPIVRWLYGGDLVYGQTMGFVALAMVAWYELGKRRGRC